MLDKQQKWRRTTTTTTTTTLPDKSVLELLISTKNLLKDPNRVQWPWFIFQSLFCLIPSKILKKLFKCLVPFCNKQWFQDLMGRTHIIEETLAVFVGLEIHGNGRYLEFLLHVLFKQNPINTSTYFESMSANKYLVT